MVFYTRCENGTNWQQDLTRFTESNHRSVASGHCLSLGKMRTQSHTQSTFQHLTARHLPRAGINVGDKATSSSVAFSDRVTTSATERNKQRLSLKLLPNFVREAQVMPVSTSPNWVTLTLLALKYWGLGAREQHGGCSGPWNVLTSRKSSRTYMYCTCMLASIVQTCAPHRIYPQTPRCQSRLAEDMLCICFTFWHMWTSSVSSTGLWIPCLRWRVVTCGKKRRSSRTAVFNQEEVANHDSAGHPRWSHLTHMDGFQYNSSFNHNVVYIML